MIWPTIKILYLCMSQMKSSRSIWNPLQCNRSLFLLLSLILIIHLSISQQPSPNSTVVYRMVHDYQKYSQKFSEMAGSQNILDMTEYSTGFEKCYEKPCKYYIYLYEPQSAKQSRESSQNLKTVLMTAGIHGNQKIGPTALLYLYPHLKGNYRIIYFPIMNPSGYNGNIRYTKDKKLIDANRDYPIDNNNLCYQASSTRIIDQIFRKYQIDLTVNLHNGGSQIGWNWGTKVRSTNSHTQQYHIYRDIGYMLKLYAGYNQQLKISQMKVGTMNQVIYPAQGTLDDWAYAGSWDSSVPKTCTHYSYEAYPKNMHNGLVFLLELGQHNAPDSKMGNSEGLYKDAKSKELSNGYVSRTLRILINLMRVIDIEIKLELKQEDNKVLQLQVFGCKTVERGIFHLINASQNQSLQIRLNASQFQTPFEYSFVHQASLALHNISFQSAKIHIDYQIQCDSVWRGKGKTSFSQIRIFKGNTSIGLDLQNHTHVLSNDSEEDKKRIVQIWETYHSYIYLSLIIFMALFGLITWLLKCLNKDKYNKIRAKQLKLYQQTTETFEAEDK